MLSTTLEIILYEKGVVEELEIIHSTAVNILKIRKQS